MTRNPNSERAELVAMVLDKRRAVVVVTFDAGMTNPRTLSIGPNVIMAGLGDLQSRILDVLREMRNGGNGKDGKNGKAGKNGGRDANTEIGVPRRGLGPTIDGLRERWGKRFSGELVISKPDRMRLIQVLKGMGCEELLARWERYVECEDPWRGYEGRPLYMFLRPAHLAKFAGRKIGTAENAESAEKSVRGRIRASEIPDVCAGWTVFAEAEKRLQRTISAKAIGDWIHPMRFVGFTEVDRHSAIAPRMECTLAAKSEFCADYVEATFGDRIRQALEDVAGCQVRLTILVLEEEGEGDCTTKAQRHEGEKRL